jgi:hypothetical protein
MGFCSQTSYTKTRDSASRENSLPEVQLFGHWLEVSTKGKIIAGESESKCPNRMTRNDHHQNRIKLIGQQ